MANTPARNRAALCGVLGKRDKIGILESGMSRVRRMGTHVATNRIFLSQKETRDEGVLREIRRGNHSNQISEEGV
jgi:hypothetical protein